MHKILLLTGMTPDRRIFDRLLPLLPTAEVVEWIQPRAQESINSYAKRLSETIDTGDSVVVCGVSFGGIVARELASCLNAKACIQISSLRSPLELPPWFRVFRLIKPSPAELILKAAGLLATYWPRQLKTTSTWRLMKLGGESGRWYRWATAAVLNWKVSHEAEKIPLFQIHGDHDSTFPIRYKHVDTVIHGGGHVLPLTHYREIAGMLQQISS